MAGFKNEGYKVVSRESVDILDSVDLPIQGNVLTLMFNKVHFYPCLMGKREEIKGGNS